MLCEAATTPLLSGPIRTRVVRIGLTVQALLPIVPPMFASHSPATAASATAPLRRAARSQATLQAGDRALCTLVADS
ncbi:hypothetical protein QF021_001002 [Acidovorax delafieldii]|nr:hypothetical protein [Acidovorax delafieldii]